MIESVTFDVTDLHGTQTLGHELAGLLRAGHVLALIGPLGAGKTQLVRAIAEGLGIGDGRLVCSPTFVLIQEYSARLPIYHFDTYRLQNAEEFFELGVQEYFNAGGVCLVEWGDRVEKFLPPDHLRIIIGVTGEASRRFVLEATGPASRQVVSEIAGRRAQERENAG
jgi:tRNA threonylcarbamoyladenosine biosynthesis protein TsaE